MKLAIVFKLDLQRQLLMFLMKLLAWLMIMLVFVLFIKTIICFLKGSLVVIFIYGLTDFDLLSKSFTSMIFLSSKLGKASLMQIMSSTFDFKVCVYDFLLLLPVYGFSLAKKSLFG